ncbi:ethanolamine ammonia-lyase subunit EutC [Chryseomicrobium palamuruense]|uniref:Ethanolamine ammonia-lyase small subunit n=1 Tax=Chryseomicrobium palamuruense TaxID=682973 RepID=A0ABV8UVZ2_9BACL
MNEQLVEQITKLVMAELNEIESASQSASVALRSTSPKGRVEIEKRKKEPEGTVTLHSLTSSSSKPVQKQSKVRESFSPSVKAEESRQVEKKNAAVSDDIRAMKKTTPARIGVGRAGSRPKTDTWLQFRFDHAAAVDAVYGEVPDELIERLGFFQVTTRVKDKEEYILRPDLGRRLSDDSKEKVKRECKKNPTVQIISSNGLSAKAVEENLEDVYLSLQQALKQLNLDVGTPFYIDKGRVALMDEIGELLQPDVVIYLIGERPGLVSAESLSAYVCYQPRFGTIEADRMVVSNIHKGGIPAVEAGAYLGTLIKKILHYQASGVNLVKKEA